MPRFPRLALANYPHHLVHRGHNQQDVFFSNADRRAYLDTLVEFRNELKLSIYGYCLMTNHVHLIINPGNDVANLGRLMKRLAGRHTRRINHMRERSGTLWGGRFKCSPIDSDRYMLCCLRYVDLNPVRAKLVESPASFHWSSFRAHVGLEECAWLDLDPSLQGLSPTHRGRQMLYREFVSQGDDPADLRFIRESLQRGHLTAPDELAGELEESAPGKLPQRQRGRPRTRIELAREPDLFDPGEK